MKNVSCAKDDTHISRIKILQWINRILFSRYKKLEDLCSGAAYCQLFHILRPTDINMKNVKCVTNIEHEYAHNYRILQKSFKRAGVTKEIPIEKLVAGRRKDTLEFVRWFKEFFEANIVIKVSNDDMVQQHNKPMGSYSQLIKKTPQSSTKKRKILPTSVKTDPKLRRPSKVTFKNQDNCRDLVPNISKRKSHQNIIQQRAVMNSKEIAKNLPFDHLSQYELMQSTPLEYSEQSSEEIDSFGSKSSTIYSQQTPEKSKSNTHFSSNGNGLFKEPTIESNQKNHLKEMLQEAIEIAAWNALVDKVANITDCKLPYELKNVNDSKIDTLNRGVQKEKESLKNREPFKYKMELPTIMELSPSTNISIQDDQEQTLSIYSLKDAETQLDLSDLLENKLRIYSSELERSRSRSFWHKAYECGAIQVTLVFNDNADIDFDELIRFTDLLVKDKIDCLLGNLYKTGKNQRHIDLLSENINESGDDEIVDIFSTPTSPLLRKSKSLPNLEIDEKAKLQEEKKNLNCRQIAVQKDIDYSLAKIALIYLACKNETTVNKKEILNIIYDQGETAASTPNSHCGDEEK